MLNVAVYCDSRLTLTYQTAGNVYDWVSDEECKGGCCLEFRSDYAYVQSGRIGYVVTVA